MTDRKFDTFSTVDLKVSASGASYNKIQLFFFFFNVWAANGLKPVILCGMDAVGTSKTASNELIFHVKAVLILEVYCATLLRAVLYGSSTYLVTFKCILLHRLSLLHLPLFAQSFGQVIHHRLLQQWSLDISSTTMAFFFHGTISTLLSCFPSHCLSEIHCFSICRLHPWLAVLRIDLWSFEYIMFHILPSYSTMSHRTKQSHLKCY